MRLDTLARELAKAKRLPYFITSLPNIDYLTGFKGSYAFLIVGKEKSFFISDSRYQEYALKILPPGVEFCLQKDDIVMTIREILDGAGAKRLYLEEHSLTLSAYYLLTAGLKKIKLERGGDAVNTQRTVKDEAEIEVLREAAAITDRCMARLLEFIRPGVTEWDVSNEIENFYRTSGCRKSSFTSIVASGSGSSMPHYVTSMEKEIRSGDVVLVDMGCTYRGYNSDLTRTVFVGSIDDRMKRIYGIVREAQERAVAAVKPGITAGKLDATARGIIAGAGFGPHFGHSLGHGVGLDVHELPAIRPKSPYRLRKNMVITIEPGIYLPDIGGVRIEDMVLVTARGREVLSKFTKDIVIV
jgi:Xaa-Pro aminopeptidase